MYKKPFIIFLTNDGNILVNYDSERGSLLTVKRLFVG